MRLHVVINPAAGSIQGDDSDEARIRAAFADTDVRVGVEAIDPGEFRDALPRIWRDAPDLDAIVVAGGDGSVNAAANAAAGTDIVLSVLPLGTFNHFAQDLGLPNDLAGAARALTDAELRTIDVGEVNGRVFVNNSVLGVYPTMVAERDRIVDDRGWGKIRAASVAVVHVARNVPIHRFDLRGSGGFRRQKLRTPFVFVGNGTYDNAAGGLAQRDDLTDGTLGLAIARTVSVSGMVRTAVRALLRGAVNTEDLDLVELSELEVDGGTGRLRVAIDGEVDWFEVPLRYRVRDRDLNVLAPRTPPDPATT